MDPDKDSTLPMKGPGGAAAPERYVLGDKLGEGGMGIVYAARDTALERDVAIKVLGDRYLGAEHQERLEAEARAMARLHHPNVVAVYDVGQRAGRTFIAMELVRGVSLSTWLDTPRTWREIVEVIRAAADGLAAAHAAGIVHRDVKPTNILVGDDGRPRVADFGVAHAADRVPSPGQLVVADTTGMIGTPAYMSLEQLCGERSDERADQFGLCATLYEALHGVRPFDEKTVSAQILAIARGAPPPVRVVPSWLHRVVARGLAADAGRRFASMTKLADALRGPRRRAVALAAAGVAIAATVVIAVAVTRPPADSSAPSPSESPRVAATEPPPTTPAPAVTSPPPVAAVLDAAMPDAVTADAAMTDAAPARPILAARPRTPPIDAGTTPTDASPSPEQLARDAAKSRYLEVMKLAEAAGVTVKARDLYEQAIPLIVEAGFREDYQARMAAAKLSCKLDDVPRARAHLEKLPKLTRAGRGARIEIVTWCEKNGVELIDALEPEERRFAQP